MEQRVRHHLTICLLAAALLYAVPAASQGSSQPSTIVRLGEFIRSPGHLEAVRAAITAFEPTALAAKCRDVKPTRSRTWRPLEEPVFDGAAQTPRTAAWQEVWEVTACGKTTVRSLGFLARPGQGIVPLPMFPGESLADLRLQVEAGQLAIDVPAPGLLSCQDRERIQIIASTVTNRAQLGSGRWSERWTVAGCGRTADIDVEFTQGPQGRPNFEFRTRARR